MLGFILFSIIVVITAFEISQAGKINISIALPISFNTIVLLLYLFGLFNCLLVGVILVVSAPSVLFLFAIMRKRITKAYILQQFSSPIVFIWIFCVILLIVIFNGRLIWMGDDLNHWALVVKNMYFNDRFCIGDNIHIYMTNYPEFNALPAYLALKLNGEFDEGVLYAANILWEIVLLCPFFYNIKIKDFFKSISALAVIILLPLFYGFQVMFWNTLQVDNLLGFAFAHCLLMAFSSIKRNERVLALITGCLTLTLLKLTGFYLVLFVVVVLVVRKICENDKKNIIGKLKEPAILFGCSLVGYFSWNIYIRFNQAVVWVNTNRYEGFDTVLEFIGGKGSLIRYDTLKRAIERIFSFEYAKIGAMNCYILWLTILIGGIVLIGFIKKKRTIVYSVLFVLGFIIWWFGVLFVTIFKFSEEEMLVLSSYDRYLYPYFIGVLFAILGLLYMEKYKKKNTVIFFVLLFLFVCTYQTIQFNIGYFYSSEESQVIQRNNIEAKCEEFLRAKESGLFNPQKDRIYIISQEEGALSADYYDAEFLMAPVPVNLLCSYNIPANVNLSYCLGKPYSVDDIWTTPYSVEEFSNALDGFSHLFILNYDQNFYNNYGSMFENGAVHNGLYLIKRNNASIMFEHIGS